MFDNNILAERLHLLRTQANISQTILAESIGVSYHAISKIENKQRSASIEVILAIAKYFNVSVDYLIGRIDKPDFEKESNDLTADNEKEKELLINFRLLNGLEQNVILGKVSEIIYTNRIKETEIEVSDELINTSVKNRLNK